LFRVRDKIKETMVLFPGTVVLNFAVVSVAQRMCESLSATQGTMALSTYGSSMVF
jgi:hypothetical protein